MQEHWQRLYALQDRVLHVLRGVDQGFHLTGGTALSRGYCNHRYSQDLDFFVNDHDEFGLWRDRCLDALERLCATHRGHSLEIILREARFGRAVVHADCDLQLEFVNDVPSRVGEPILHPVLGSLDTRENILANKITAIIDRSEPKDLADIYWLCCRENLSLSDGLNAAGSKAAGVFPPLLAKRLEQAAAQGTPDVYWIAPPNEREFRTGIQSIIDTLLQV